MTGVAVTNKLLKQTNALANYLDEMLHDATLLFADTVDKSAKSTGKLETIEFSLIEDITIDEGMSQQKQITELDEVQGVDPLNIIEMAEHVLNFEPKANVDLESNYDKPSDQFGISRFPIQCLMFRVGDNLLSIPLIEMVGVVQWTDELTQLPQSFDGVLGILKYRDAYIRVLDSLKVLEVSARTVQKPGYVLILSDKKSGISCDTLEDVVALEYDDIQWQVPEKSLMHGIIRARLAYLLSASGIINRFGNVNI